MRVTRSVFLLALAAAVGLSAAGCRKSRVATDPNAKPTARSAAEPAVRIIHAVAGAPSVDVYLGDRRIASGLSYKMASDYAPLPATRIQARVTEAGSSNELMGALPLAFHAPGVYTVIAAGNATGDVNNIVLMDDLAAPAKGSARIRFVNAAEAPPVDIYVNDRITISDLPAGRATGAYAQWDAGSYPIAVKQATGAGTALLGPVPVELKGGGVYTAVLVGGYSDRTLSLQVYRDR